ncbi:unnamed protein product [Rotaria magnacalcarata]|uniref:Arrestin C-terminal-like domain-containing protein n=1 Tax=Rotaria magnacalcarata TaxID=392030 RepID=A0A814UZV0_9BILA|nr:unnamed protein product [Rotaria magnacalcarata]
MKLNDIFDGNRANLKGLSMKKNIFLSYLIHKTYITVDEKGVRAAATPIVRIMLTTSTRPDVNFLCNKPFIYAIRYKQTTLFMGRISLFSNSTDEQQQQQQQQLTFPPGKNSWPFSFSIPEFLPPSATQLKSYSQYIEYSIDFEIMRPRLCRRNIEKTFVIPVQNSLRIAADRQVQDQKENQNIVSLRGYLENNVVVTGTTFTLHFEVDNPNGSTINKISTYLVQNRQFAASPKEQFIINEHKIKDPQGLQKNQVKDKIDFILPTTLPATCSYHPPSWLPVQDIDIDYYVLIQLHMNRSIEDIVLELPVIVTAVTEPTIDIPPSYESIFSTRQ